MFSNQLLPVVSDPVSFNLGLFLIFTCLGFSLRMIGVWFPVQPHFIYMSLLGTDPDLYKKESDRLFAAQSRVESALLYWGLASIVLGLYFCLLAEHKNNQGSMLYSPLSRMVGDPVGLRIGSSVLFFALFVCTRMISFAFSSYPVFVHSDLLDNHSDLCKKDSESLINDHDCIANVLFNWSRAFCGASLLFYALAQKKQRDLTMNPPAPIMVHFVPEDVNEMDHAGLFAPAAVIGVQNFNPVVAPAINLEIDPAVDQRFHRGA